MSKYIVEAYNAATARRKRIAEAMERKWVIVFKNRFADMIRSGRKVTTIHPVRRRPINVGDRLSLRIWSGRPYASKQIVLIEPWCSGVHDVTLGVADADIVVNGQALSYSASNLLASRDGFDSLPEMLELFKAMHGLPFTGQMISWDAA